ncbi:MULTISPECIES: 8-oxo-dGTP diphosphatase [Arthrobacter]|uniref:Oxidized purine nucleoside triphosphate hydrolase n=1 Tax=Arthrobacter terricola TaxID=2547396 RepID=A0A4R5K6X4_9MICC|nr:MULTISPECIES: 8-oxo-dGTP diphosphatase [Arthrobacter]MBT8159294.1 8-oxo-dGTP diphosphatase [Arthrobacter sp. GN70]TDF87363.1 8-oxo-dGTP diphosphatase [Arthrobacter terricola]HKU36148.1 8-oxo-dGTP diphosphatase [Paenarthrobacter sp.]
MTAAAVTLCFLLREVDGSREVLLGRKRTGFGRGKVVGIGGHLEAGETAAEAVCREVDEEVHVIVAPEDLIPAGTVDFVFPSRPEWNMFTTVFLTESWVGEPSESDEIVPQWYPAEDLPVAHMWADAEHWLPAMMNGRRMDVRVVLADDNESVAGVFHSDWADEAASASGPGRKWEPGL